MSQTYSPECEVEYDPKNGLILVNHCVPEEVLVHILSFVDVKSLALSCRLVCHRWKETVQSLVLKYKAEREGLIKLRENPNLTKRLHWVDYYWVLYKKPFALNLLENNCGQYGMASWKVLSSRGDGWLIESVPAGSDTLPPVSDKGEPQPDFNGLTSCFVTSYATCSKCQMIDLNAKGLTTNFMDHMQPPIEISEWIALRWDCGGIYELEVSLLDCNKEPLQVFKVKEDFNDLPRRVWHQVKHTFQDYGPGVRYLNFLHHGRDTQYWAGHYGSKMSGGSVRVLRRL